MTNLHISPIDMFFLASKNHSEKPEFFSIEPILFNTNPIPT
ncbi:hypothetical protein P872_04095 [Rhodonellum psychrophilum GCM71 = DSM 17998]|uniref:Uncharacterized protein n=1 Tax=Rhodonellum psychrophilum GCM71 = DSM 17998 TaxID=1123057 RepID=U5BQ58_9BACT|nr:hypothetical protein P872_04095 [Rhodonellum psychrophilum GCM71 = DSM 17998]